MVRDETITVGTGVFADDGEKVGEVAAVHPAYLVVERGLILPEVFYVPRDAYRAQGDRLVLGVAAAAIERQGWGTPPAGTDPDRETAAFPTGDEVQLNEPAERPATKNR